MTQDSRTLRVYAHFSKRERNHVLTPEIKLQGIYLEQAGFEVGDFINVSLTGGKIVIEKGGSHE